MILIGACFFTVSNTRTCNNFLIAPACICSLYIAIYLCKAMEYCKYHNKNNYESFCIVFLNLYFSLLLYDFDLTLFRPMEFSIKLHTKKSGWPTVYIEGSYAVSFS